MKNRLEDIYSYGIFDTPAERELDEITELASIICDTPISLITVLDDKRQWFKSNRGLEVNETQVKDSFCQYTLNKPNEVLIVNDALKDKRFVKNKLVLQDPHIRFYAGAPLLTKQNNVLGTLCVIDRKPKQITKEQVRALSILAKKAMEILESNKSMKKLHSSVRMSTERLTKITENIPLGIFELEVLISEELKFLFLSSGMESIHPGIKIDEWIECPSIGFSLMHPEDVKPMQEAISLCVSNQQRIYHEYRVKSESGYDWHAIYGQPQKTEAGTTVIYGAFTDISHHFDYEMALDQINFDISHVIRRPVTTMLGVVNLLESEKKLSEKKLKEYSSFISLVSQELEKLTRDLNEIYADKKRKIKRHTDKFKN